MMIRPAATYRLAGIRLAVALLACLLALLAEWQRPDLTVRLDEALRDAFLRVYADESPEDRLLVLDLNEASLREDGPWPWPRGRVADLVEILLGVYEARAVGLDMVFAEAGDAGGDARLASLAEHAPLALAQILDYVPRSPPLRVGSLQGGVPATPGSETAVMAFGYMANHPRFERASHVGNIGYQPDPDGVLRRIPWRTQFEGLRYDYFSAALLSSDREAASQTVRSLGDVRGFWRIPFSKAQTAYTVISASDVLHQRVPKAQLAGRYVLVGSSSLGLGDSVSTPLAPLAAGVMVHAASLSGLLDLQQGHVLPPRSGRIGLALWCVLSIGLVMAAMSHLSAWGALLLILGFASAWTGIALAGVARQFEWSVSAPLLAYAFLLIVAVPFEWLLTQRRNRKVLETFSHYVAQPVLDEIVRLDMRHSLEPSLRDVTVLIADMEGYTNATSQLSLEDAARLTKDFLDCLTRPVLQWHGTIDKYTGDGLVAFWGAPLDCPDQADRAVSAALDVISEVACFNAKRLGANQAPLRVRIGIESGRAMVGDMGTPFRSTYTAVGDCINFASRLEAAARDLPAQLVIGSAAQGLLVRHRTRSLGQITLRGTATCIEVFTVRE